MSKHQDPLEEGMATHCSILAWRISWTEEPGWGGHSPWGHKESNMTEQLSTQHRHQHETRQIYFAEFQLLTLELLPVFEALIVHNYGKTTHKN